MLKTIDPRGAETRFGYDRQNRMILRDAPTSTNNDRAVWRYEYTGNGGLRKTTDPLGGVSESTYDDLDRISTSTQVERKPVTDNFTTKYTYDDADRLLSTTSPTGATSSTTYDSIGQPIKATDPSNVVTQFGYDFLGRQIESVDGLGRASLTTYDLADRVLQSTDYDAAQTELRKNVYTVDADSNVLTSKPPVGGTVSYTYDALGQLVRQQEPTSGSQTITTSFGYDAAGNQTRYTDGRGNSTYTTVNSLGLTESVIEPSTAAHPAAADRTWTTSYDVGGNAVRLAEPGGVTRTRTFDTAGRLTDEAGSGTGVQAADRKIGYDALSQVTSVNSIGADNTYTYNDRGQVLSSNGPSGSATFSFDADGSLVQRTDASGTADFGYTKGRLTSVTDPVTRTQQTYGYDNAGAPKTISYGLGRTRTFDYDDLGRLKSDGLKNNAGNTVASDSYTYDLSDDLTGKTTTGVQGAGTNTYIYDDAGRLKTWTGGGKTTTYGWDEAGNRTQVDGKTARFDERNRLITDGTADYSYSARGTLLSKTTGSTTESTSFDAFDRVISQGGRTYQYDGTDRPVTGNGTTMQYAGFSDEVVSDGTQTYGRGPDDEILSISQGTTKRLVMSDSHDDVIGGFDPTDATLASLPDSRTYDPFGKVTASGGLTYGVGYQGDWNDPATGDVNMGARWYDPDTGTFTSRDTASYSGGDSAIANKYLYGNANPLSNIDPTGFSSCKPQKKKPNGPKKTQPRTPKPKPDPPRDNRDRGQDRPEHDPNRNGRDNPVGPGGDDPYPVGPGGYDWRAMAVSSVLYDADSSAGSSCPPPPPPPKTCKQTNTCPKPKPPPPPDPAIKARKQLEQKVKNNPQPNVTAITKPIFAQGNPTGGGNSKNLINDTRGQADEIYKNAVTRTGPVANDADEPFNPFANPTPGDGHLKKPSWGDLKDAFKGIGKFIKDNKSAIGHAVLDTVGLIPGVGEVADLANAAWYAAEGDYVNAALSAASAIPFAGYAATVAKAGRYVNKGIKLGKEGKEARNLGKAAEDIGRACKCFPAGTTVDTSTGAKPIEDIKVGDKVWARDQLTGKSSLQEVTSLFQKHTTELMTITLVGGGVVAVTTEHPFYTPDRGWVESGDLKPGDKLLQRDGKTAYIASITHTTTATTVYNFSVANDHNYYVGNAGLLVHNCPILGADDAADAADDAGRYLAKKAPKQVTPGTRRLEGQHVNDQGRVEPWVAHYDEYGRQIGRTDYNAGNRTAGIPPTHYHRYEYGPGRQGGQEVESHIPGEFPG